MFLCDTGIFCNKNQKMNRPKSSLFLQKTCNQIRPLYWGQMHENIANISTFSMFRGHVGGVCTWNWVQMSSNECWDVQHSFAPGPVPSHDPTAPRSAKMKKNCFNYPSYLDSLLRQSPDLKCSWAGFTLLRFWGDVFVDTNAFTWS